MTDRKGKDWVQTFGTVLIGVGVSMWIIYAVGRYFLGWNITDREFLPYHLATILPGMILRYHRFFFEYLPQRFSRGKFTKVTISKSPSPSPSPARGEGYTVSPPLRGGDKGEGDLCVFTKDRVSRPQARDDRDQVTENRSAFLKALVVVNNFVHDLSTGLWVSSIVVIYLLDMKTRTPEGLLVSPALHDVMRTFFWLGIASIAVILATGSARLLYYRTESAGDDREIKKNLLIVKHVLFTFVFIGGTYIAYIYAFS